MIRPVLACSLFVVLSGCGASEPAAKPPTDAKPIVAPATDASAPTARNGTETGEENGPKGGGEVAEGTSAMSKSTNGVSFKVLSALRSEKGNVFFSATSLRGALGMTALGAKGKTLDELSAALAIDPNAANNVAAAKAEVAAWKAAAGKSELVIANRLWLEKSATLEKTFVAQTADGYGAQPESVDFAKAPEPSRKRINGWVSDTTKGKITNLLPEGSINPLTRLVLTNAIYFKGAWVDVFKKELTKDEPFKTASASVNVPTMHRTGVMSYAENDSVELVELPYKESDLAFLVVLPRKAEDLGKVVTDITSNGIDAWTKTLTRKSVALSLPKFTFAWGRSVKRELDQLGIKAAFSSQADFSGISSTMKDLYVSDVFHKAFVLVDETGTEAAAATGAVMVVRAAVMEPKTVKVDHPFLFFVRNTKTGDILFVGRVENPKG